MNAHQLRSRAGELTEADIEKVNDITPVDSDDTIRVLKQATGQGKINLKVLRRVT